MNGRCMEMIHVKENFLDYNVIAIDVGGVLDQAAVPVLKSVCDRHLRGRRKILLNLAAVVHITREGRGFIQAIQEKVSVANLPEFMRLEQEP
jgi:hypothetical protein